MTFNIIFFYLHHRRKDRLWFVLLLEGRYINAPVQLKLLTPDYSTRHSSPWNAPQFDLNSEGLRELNSSEAAQLQPRIVFQMRLSVTPAFDRVGPGQIKGYRVSPAVDGGPSLGPTEARMTAGRSAGVCRWGGRAVEAPLASPAINHHQVSGYTEQLTLRIRLDEYTLAFIATDGRTKGWNEGRKDGMKDGRKDWRTKGRKNGKMDGRTKEERKDESTDEHMQNGRTDRQTIQSILLYKS